MRFDLVITTFNRPDSVLRLLEEVKLCEPSPEKIIVVDSSDVANEMLLFKAEVLYIHASHKNQPYQRLLGAHISNAEVVVYLDDDLEIIKFNIFEIILLPFRKSGVVGSSVCFAYDEAPLTNYHEYRKQGTRSSSLLKSIWFLTGVPQPTSGLIHRLGVVGKLPKEAGFIASFNGANMTFLRSIIFSIIPDDLLSMAELKLQSGEDKVISMLATVHGKLWYNPEVCLVHPINDSTYFENTRTFAAKVSYSRLYLSRIYALVFHKPWWKERLIYYWFTFWRIFIAFVSLVICPSKEKKDKLIGILYGTLLVFRLSQNAERLTPRINWKAEIQKDLRLAGN